MNYTYFIVYKFLNAVRDTDLTLKARVCLVFPKKYLEVFILVSVDIFIIFASVQYPY